MFDISVTFKLFKEKITLGYLSSAFIGCFFITLLSTHSDRDHSLVLSLKENPMRILTTWLLKMASPDKDCDCILLDSQGCHPAPFRPHLLRLTRAESTGFWRPNWLSDQSHVFSTETLINTSFIKQALWWGNADAGWNQTPAGPSSLLCDLRLTALKLQSLFWRPGKDR